MKNYLIDFMKDNELSIYEGFKIKEYPGDVYRIVDRKEEGKDLEYVLEYLYAGSGSSELTSYTAYELLSGKLTIVKLPWKPKENDCYFYIDVTGSRYRTSFNPHNLFDRLNYFSGNCFETKEKAMKNSDKIIKEVFGGYFE